MSSREPPVRGSHQSRGPEPLRPCCVGAWPPGTGLWPDSGVKYSVRWPLGGLPGPGPLCRCSRPARGHSAHSRFSVLLSRRVLEAPGLCLSPSPPPQFPGWPRPASWLWLCAAGSPAFGTSAADSSCGHAAARGQPHRLAAASPARPGLPHTWASAPGVSLDRPRPPHRVTSKLPAMASRAGRGCVSRCTPISPWPAARPRSSQGDSASVQATSSLLPLISKSSGRPTLPPGTRS